MPAHYRSLPMNNGRCTKYFQYFLITPNIVVLFLQTKLSIVGTHFISFFFLISGRSSVRNAPVLTDSQILSFTLSRSFARCFIDSFPSAFVLFEPVFLFCFVLGRLGNTAVLCWKIWLIYGVSRKASVVGPVYLPRWMVVLVLNWEVPLVIVFSFCAHLV